MAVPLLFLDFDTGPLTYKLVPDELQMDETFLQYSGYHEILATTSTGCRGARNKRTLAPRVLIQE